MDLSTDELKKRLETTLRVAQILTAGFIIPIFLYPMVVISTLGQNGVGPGFHGHARMESSLVVFVGVLLIFATPRITQFFLKVTMKQRLEQPNHAKLIAAYLLTVTVSGALRELAAIMGMILSLLERNLFWCILLGVTAFFSIARNWPTKSDLQTLFPEVRL